MLVIFWFIMVGLFVAVWLAPLLLDKFVYPRISAEISVQNKVVHVGDLITFQCRLINPTRLPCSRIRVSCNLPDHLSNDLGGARTSFVEFSTYIMPRQQADVSFTVRAMRRGLVKLDQANVTFYDALNIREFFRIITFHAAVIVRPKRELALNLPAKCTDLLGDERAKRHFNEDASLFMGVRPYQRGDAYRHISWVATAKAQDLMVKQFGYTTDFKYWIVFNGQTTSPFWYAGNRDVIDRLCQRVVQLADGLLQQGASVGFMTNLYDGVHAGSIEPASARKDQLARISNRMGAVSPYAQIPAEKLFFSAQKNAAYGDTLLVVTSYLDQAGAQALQTLQRKSSNVILYYINPENGSVLPAIYGIPQYIEALSVS